MEIVPIAPAAEAVGAFEKFVTDAGAPCGGERGDIGNFLDIEIFGVGAADDHGEGVLEAERLGDFEAKALGVELLDAIVNGSGIAMRSMVASREEISEVKEIKEAKESAIGAVHVRRPLAFVREGRGENRRGGRGAPREWHRRG